jgi:ribosomal protein S18 acetylase RimI-like enzyme
MTQQSLAYSTAITYLSRDPYVNRELLIALHYEVVTTVVVARQGNTVTGALVRSPAPVGHGSEWVRLEADDDAAVHQLVSQVNLNEPLVFSIHRPWIGELLTAHYGLLATSSGMYGYLIDKTQLTHIPSSEPRLLTPADVSLVERSVCGWTPAYFKRLMREKRQAWVIVRDDQIVCRASSGFPHEQSEEVVGVWTHPNWRQRGFARMLVAALVADILERSRYAVYTTTYNNGASQAVARAVGFQPCFAATSYEHPERTRPSQWTVDY